MKDIDWLKEMKIAHRGLHDKKVPENSLSAFKKAMDHGYAIECDIQASLEGLPVVFHDANLKRMTGLDKMIYTISQEALNQLSLKETSDKIPSLKDVLNLVQGKVPLLIEIKSESPIVSLTHQVLMLLNDYQGKVAIHSFDPKVVRLLKKEAPHLLRGQIACYFKNESMFFLKKWALKHMIYNLINGPDFVTYAIEDAPNKMLNRHRKKMPIIGYTAKNKKAYNEALDYFDNAVFEGFEA